MLNNPMLKSTRMLISSKAAKYLICILCDSHKYILAQDIRLVNYKVRS